MWNGWIYVRYRNNSSCHVTALQDKGISYRLDLRPRQQAVSDPASVDDIAGTFNYKTFNQKKTKITNLILASHQSAKFPHHRPQQVSAKPLRFCAYSSIV